MTVFLWKEQCQAAVTIQKNWGTRQALEYLVAEKFLNFVREGFRHAEFEEQLFEFAGEIRRLFPPETLVEFLDDLERNPMRRADDDPLWAAEEIVAVRKARTLLL